jgi:uncharacterized protein (DUF1778 family)
MEKRIYEITVRVSERERALMREQAARAERSVSDWLRVLATHAARAG